MLLASVWVFATFFGSLQRHGMTLAGSFESSTF